MEKIQAAIAKARAAREGQAPAAPARPATGQAAPRAQGQARAGAGPRDAAWTALPEISPDPAHLKRQRLVAFEGGALATSFDVMRTRTLQQMRANGWKRLAITSPSAGCGKSTMSLNLGFSLARQPEIHTMVVEMDMRRPSIAKALALRERHSVADVLAGAARVEDNAVRVGRNLALVTSHSSARNPSDLLQSASVGRSLAAIEERYAPDITIFDMPPMLVNDDALAFLQHVDCVLLVAAAGATTIKEVDTCERELAAHTNVMGVVLNKCRYMGRDYGNDYYN